MPGERAASPFHLGRGTRRAPSSPIARADDGRRAFLFPVLVCWLWSARSPPLLPRGEMKTSLGEGAFAPNRPGHPEDYKFIQTQIFPFTAKAL